VTRVDATQPHLVAKSAVKQVKSAEVESVSTNVISSAVHKDSSAGKASVNPQIATALVVQKDKLVSKAFVSPILAPLCSVAQVNSAKTVVVSPSVNPVSVNPHKAVKQVDVRKILVKV